MCVVFVCVFVQMLIKDLESMFSSHSLEIHALLVWKYYVKLLGTVSGSLSVRCQSSNFVPI